MFGTVKEGLIGRHLTFVPLAGITIDPDNLQVAVSRSRAPPTSHCTATNSQERTSRPLPPLPAQLHPTRHRTRPPTRPPLIILLRRQRLRFGASSIRTPSACLATRENQREVPAPGRWSTYGSRAGANDGESRLCRPDPKRLRKGKEGVDGSSPSESSARAPYVGAFSFRSTCSLSNVRWAWSRFWSFRVQSAATLPFATAARGRAIVVSVLDLG
jgi:hypothetical protein